MSDQECEEEVLSLLARRLVELFLDIGIRFGFGSFGIRLGMAGPVIVIDFRWPIETGRRRGIERQYTEIKRWKTGADSELEDEEIEHAIHMLMMKFTCS